MDSSQQIPLDQLLTAQQKAYACEYAPKFVREHIAAMLSTTPVDEEEIKILLSDIYCFAKLPPPTIRWFDSPISFVHECLRVGNPYSKHEELSHHLQEQVWGSWWLRSPYDQFLWSKVGSNVYSALRMSDDLRIHVRENVYNRLWLWERLRGYIRRRCERETTWGSAWWSVLVTHYISCSIISYHNAIIFVSMSFLDEILKKDNCINMMRFNELVLGYWLGDKEAWLVRKPVFLERDEQGRWHNASGPCVQYRDGRGWYAWHGVTVPEQIILHPERLTKWDWIRQQNVEVRRAIQERLGNERFIEMVGGKQIDIGRRGKLIEIKLGRHDPERVARFVQVQDTSTKRQY